MLNFYRDFNKLFAARDSFSRSKRMRDIISEYKVCFIKIIVFRTASIKPMDGTKFRAKFNLEYEAREYEKFEMEI